MNPQFFISKIIFNDSTELLCDKNDIIVFVGANNVGKSLSLKEISSKFRSKSNKSKIIREIYIDKDGSEDEIKQNLENNSLLIENNGYPMYQGFGYQVGVQDSKHYISNFSNGVAELFPYYANILNTEQRLLAANPAQNIKLTSQAIQHPIHFLQKNDKLENTFNEYFNQAFGKDLVVHRNAGSEVPLYVGKKPTPAEGEDRVSEGYIRELEKLDLLHEQGDGMRSFVGVLLNSFISHHTILFIDEPEAFLHPPQAKLLGNTKSGLN